MHVKNARNNKMTLGLEKNSPRVETCMSYKCDGWIKKTLYPRCQHKHQQHKKKSKLLLEIFLDKINTIKELT